MTTGIPQDLARSAKAFAGRTWLFDRLSMWALTEETPGFLIVGPPGSGKSLIAARLVQDAFNSQPSQNTRAISNHLCFAHFCRFNSPNVDPLRLIEGIAGALASQYPSYRDALSPEASQTIINVHGEASVEMAQNSEVTGVRISINLSSERSATRAFDEIVSRPLQKLRESGYDDPLFVIIDALDETLGGDLRGASSMIGFLGAILHPNSGLPSGLRFILTSRPDSRITSILRNSAAVVQIVEDEPTLNDDVSLFLGNQYRELGTKFLSELANKSKGNFLYAYYVAEDARSHHIIHDETTTAYRFPAGLDDIYRNYLERELTHDQETWRRMVRPVLGLLCIGHGDGIPLEFLAAITHLRRSQLYDVLDSLGQFVSRRPDDGLVRLYHDSFREFLTRSSEPRVYTDEALDDLSHYLLEMYDQGCPPQSSDGQEYYMNYLPLHLREAGESDKLQQLLLDIRWYEQKLPRLDTVSLLKDLELAYPWIPAVGLARILRMSANVLDEHPEQLRSQLVGRLIDNQNEDLRNFCAQLRADLSTVWLRPSTASMSTALGPETLTFHPHAGPVQAIAYSPTARVLLSCSREPFIRAWSIEEGGQTFMIEAPTGPATTLVCSPNQPIAASGHADGSIHVWDLNTRSLVVTLQNNTSSIVGVLFSRDSESLYSLYENGMVVGYSLSTSQSFAEQAIQSPITAAAASPLSRDLFVNTAEGIAYQLSASNLEVTRIFHQAGDPGFWSKCAAVHPDGRTLVTSGHDRLNVFNIETGDLQRSKYLGHVFFGHLMFASSGEMLVGLSSRLMLLDANYDYISSLGGELNCVTFCGRDDLVATGSLEGSIKLWELAGTDLNQENFRSRGRIAHITLSDDQRIAAIAAAASDTIYYWDLIGQRMLGTAKVDPELWYNRRPEPVGVAISPDGRYSVAAGDMGAVCTVAIEKLVSLHSNHEWGKKLVIPNAQAVGTPVNGNVAAIADRDAISLWDMTTGKSQARVPLDDRSGLVAIVGPIDDSVFILTRSTLLEVSVSKRRIISRVAHGGQVVGSLGWFREGPTAIAANQEGEFVCLRSGGDVRNVSIPSLRSVQLFATCPTARSIVVTTRPGWVSSWNWDTSRLEWKLQVGRQPVRSLVVSPDESWVVASGDGDEIALLNLEAGLVIASFVAEAQISAMQVSKLAKMVLVGETSGRVHFLEVMGMP